VAGQAWSFQYKMVLSSSPLILFVLISLGRSWILYCLLNCFVWEKDLDWIAIMSSIEKRVTGRYTSLEDQSFEVQDFGHESDSTAYSEGFLSKAGAIVGERRISRAKRVQEALTWVRWGTVVSLQLLIVILLFIKMPNGSDEMGAGEFGKVEMGGDINGIYKSSKSRCSLSARRLEDQGIWIKGLIMDSIASHKITPFKPEPDLYMPNMSNPDEGHRLAIQANWDKLMPSKCTHSYHSIPSGP